VTIFGGFAPTIIDTFVRLTSDKLAPSYYVLIAALPSGLSLVVVAWRRWSAQRDGYLPIRREARGAPCRRPLKP